MSFNLTPYNLPAMNFGNQDYFGLGSGSMPTSFGGNANQLVNPMGNQGGSGFNLPDFDKEQSPEGLFGINGLTTGNLQLGINGLSTLGNLWGGFKSLGLANKQFDFSKMIAEKNLANSTSAYNTALNDKITSRAKAQGMSDQETQAYLSKNSLK